MGSVVQLPTAAPAPLPKKRWRGCYPRGVIPLSRQRLKRQRDSQEQEGGGPSSGGTAPQSPAEWNNTYKIVSEMQARAARREIAGAMVAVQQPDGEIYYLLFGTLRNDLQAASEAAEALCDIVYEVRHCE